MSTKRSFFLLTFIELDLPELMKFEKRSLSVYTVISALGRTFKTFSVPLRVLSCLSNPACQLQRSHGFYTAISNIVNFFKFLIFLLRGDFSTAGSHHG